jgi:hypothetical protein
MSTADVFPPLEIDPRKVERYERYLLAYARTHALDPLEHRRRELHGLLFLARLRTRRSRYELVRAQSARILPLRRKA